MRLMKVNVTTAQCSLLVSLRLPLDLARSTFCNRYLLEAEHPLYWCFETGRTRGRPTTHPIFTSRYLGCTISFSVHHSLKFTSNIHFFCCSLEPHSFEITTSVIPSRTSGLLHIPSTTDTLQHSTNSQPQLLVIENLARRSQQLLKV